jgi:hypothetical protein
MTAGSMNIGRLAWRTPTGAVLWETWGRYRVSFYWLAAILLGGELLVYWKNHGLPSDLENLCPVLALAASLGTYARLLSSFGYWDVDPKKMQMSYPVRLLLKPASTARLALAPMLFGGLTEMVAYLLWTELVLVPIGIFPVGHGLWLGAAMLSLFWWMQACSWSFSPLPLFRDGLSIGIGMAHVFVVLQPFTPLAMSPGWQWGILGVMLGTAPVAAVVGLGLVRRGAWEGSSMLAVLWNTMWPDSKSCRRRKFRSAFGTQFWFEWRKQGIALPMITGGTLFMLIPLILALAKKTTTDTAEANKFLAMALPLVVLGFPMMLSGLPASNMGKFEPLLLSTEVPVYIAIRPMTNGGFVLAKLAIAATTSVLIWLATFLVTFFWLALYSKGMLLFKGWHFFMTHNPLGMSVGFLLLLLMLVLWSWKSMVSGIAVGLAGRPWLSNSFTFWRLVFYPALGLPVYLAWNDEALAKVLWYWTPWLISICLIAKVILSVAAFRWGLKLNAVTPGAIGWFVGSWVLASLFITMYAGLVCVALDKMDVWPLVGMIAFLILPLAEFALAPLALAWNRHR